jgi:hypothetical protein
LSIDKQIFIGFSGFWNSLDFFLTGLLNHANLDVLILLNSIFSKKNITEFYIELSMDNSTMLLSNVYRQSILIQCPPFDMGFTS